ncbi:MAG TPA: hypothetical protein VHH36_06225 [Candidatus Thermoplasmatota archaeon]|nr:hypothetical protein [Candidatus Thermoplasmatota archaeon]
MDRASSGRILRASLRFDLPADVPRRDLAAAVESGLQAARAALPGEGSARGDGSLAARGEGRRARIDLVVSGPAAEASWLAPAREAFARAFLAALAANGHAAREA